MKYLLRIVLVIIVLFFVLQYLGGLLFLGLIFGGNMMTALQAKLGNSGTKIQTINFPSHRSEGTIGNVQLLDEDPQTAYLLLDNGLGVNINKKDGSVKFVDVTDALLLYTNPFESAPECNKVEKYCIILGEKNTWHPKELTHTYQKLVLKYSYTQGIISSIYEEKDNAKVYGARFSPGFLQLTVETSPGLPAKIVYINTKTQKYLINPEHLKELDIEASIFNSWLNIDLFAQADYYRTNKRDTFLDHQEISAETETKGSCGELSTCYKKFTLKRGDQTIKTFNAQAQDIPVGIFGNKYYFVGTKSTISRYIGIVDL